MAKQFPNHQFVGYEWDIIPYMLAVYKTRNLPNITIKYRDFFLEDLSEYRLILCYLGTGIEEKIGSKLNKELTSDSLVLSEVFKLSVLKLKKRIDLSWGFIKTCIYLYTPDK